MTAPGDRFRGDDRFVADYLRETVLSRLPDDQTDFLIRTSVLEELSGPDCDAVLGTEDAATTLARLADANLFVVPIDDRRERYRYHQLFRDLLLMELQHRSPELVPELSARASRWFEAQGSPDLAISHAIAGDDADRVAELLRRHAQAIFFGGRAASLTQWIKWLDAHASIEDYPAVAVIVTWFMMLEGHPFEADRWVLAARSGAVERPLEPEFEGVLLLAEAAMCRDGVEHMAESAARGLSMLPTTSPWATPGTILVALSCLMGGDVDGATEWFEKGASGASRLGTAVGASVACAEMAICHLRRSDVSEAAAWVQQARTSIDASNLAGYSTSALTYSVAALVAHRQGDPDRANAYLAEAEALRHKLTFAIPMLALQLRLELARCAAELRDIQRAKDYLAEAREIGHLRPGLGTLIDEIGEVEAELETRSRADHERPSLSPAEARLLPVLATHLSFREIGEQLFVSPHTVKTQAISIYRKLGVTSRGEAVDAARELRLLES